MGLTLASLYNDDYKSFVTKVYTVNCNALVVIIMSRRQDVSGAWASQAYTVSEPREIVLTLAIQPPRGIYP